MGDDNEALIAWARSIWPQAFTKREAVEALGTPLRYLNRIKGLMDTGVRRYDDERRKRPIVLYRFRPYQLHLPLEDRKEQSNETL